MKRKGIYFRRATHLSFRYATDKDRDEDGDPIPPGHLIIIRLADCQNEMGDFNQHRRKKAPMHGPHSHGQPNMVYGKWRKGRSTDGGAYDTCPVYWVERGSVYSGTIYRPHYEED